jgi:IMP dehydrogenase
MIFFKKVADNWWKFLKNIFAKDIMIKKIFTISPKERIALARLRMLRHGVGALPVIDEDGLLKGIITLRDIDLAGPETSELFIIDLMTKDLITGKEDTTLSEITESMIKTGLQRIPIIDDDDRLVGFITQTVIIRSLNKLIKNSS